MNIHVMIAEDEVMAQKELIYLFKKEPDVTLCPLAQTGEELMELYALHEPDVIFLDVEMPRMSGVSAANKIVSMSNNHVPFFVFTTAYEDHALEAFNINAVDYLLKPYEEERFQLALERTRERMQQREEQMIEQIQPGKGMIDKLLVEDGERMVVIDPETILYAVPFKRMLEIHTTDKIVTSKLNLQELEEKLVGHAFFRTHRSYLVNLNFIKEITPWFNGTSNVTLNDAGQTSIPVSRAARKVLLKHFNL